MRYDIKQHAIHTIQVISTDTKGMIEMWDVNSHKLPAGVRFQFKAQTDLYDLAKCKTKAYSLDLSPDGEIFACVCGDQQIRFWKCLTGKKNLDLSSSLLFFDLSPDMGRYLRASAGTSRLDSEIASQAVFVCVHVRGSTDMAQPASSARRCYLNVVVVLLLLFCHCCCIIIIITHHGVWNGLTGKLYKKLDV